MRKRKVIHAETKGDRWQAEKATSAGQFFFKRLEKKYPNQWLLIEFSKLDKDLHAADGRVLAHARSKKAIYKALLQTQGKNVSIEYVGRSPKQPPFVFCLTKADPVIFVSLRETSVQ